MPVTSTSLSELATSLATEACQVATSSSAPALATLASPTDRDPLNLLSGEHTGFWRQPGLTVAGRGVAAEVSGSGNGRLSALATGTASLLARAIARGREPIALSAARFDTGPAADGWEPFPEAVSWIPEIAVIEENGERHLVAATVVEPGQEPGEIAHRLARLIAGTGVTSTVGAGGLRTSPDGRVTPDDHAFMDRVGDALRAIERGELTKVVLARRLRTDTTADAVSLCAALLQRYPDFFGYAVIRDGAAFVGASPELLVHREGRIVRSAPAAGTVGRSSSDAMNRRLAGGLDSIKSRWEQEVVSDTVYDTLEALCESIRGSLPMVVPAGPVQHLSTAIEGTLREPAHILDLVAALHPTPAVGGSPTAEAMAFLREAEGFDRGWYAGPIGVVHPSGEGTFAVALRSALLHDGVIDLFAGAGIVEGSDPDEERREVELKLTSVASVLQPSR